MPNSRLYFGTTSGGTTTASNIGSGEGVFSSQVGDDLQFKSLVAGSNITLVSGPDSITISATDSIGVEGGTNTGLGTGVFKQRLGSNLEFKSLVAGTNVSISSDADSITISSTDTGEVNTASNIGLGSGIFSSKVGTDLEFKSLIAGTNVSISSDATSITISATDTGEVNTASNVGSGEGVFAQKVSEDLEFKSLVAGTNVSISSDATTVTISATDTGEVNTASNLGAGEGVFAQKVSEDLEFKSLVAGTNVSISSDATSVTISATDTGEVNTASNLGAGEGVFAQKVDEDLEFKSFVAGSNISLSSDADTITVSATGVGEVNTASNIGAGEGVFAQKVSEDLEFKSLVAGSNISLVSDANSVTISATGTGISGIDILSYEVPVLSSATILSFGFGLKANTTVTPGRVNIDLVDDPPAGWTASGVNVGSGEGIYRDDLANTLYFKSLVAGSNISLTSGSDTITIDATDTGEVNTASNIGTGTGVFSSKVGTDLEFKTFVAGTNVSISSDLNTITISATDTGEVNTASNLGSGEGAFAQKTGTDLEFKSFVAGTNVSITSDSTSITISATDTGEVNTASNIGSGDGIFSAKVGTDLQFKTLVAGSNITITPGLDSITIDSTGGGGGNPFDYVQFNLTPPTPPAGAGILYWDQADGNQTLSLQMAGANNVVQQIGEEFYIRVKATSAISEGQVVMITGTVGTSGVYEAQPAAGITDGHIIIGVATENIAFNDFGYVTEMGLVRGIITDGSTYGETWSDGDELFWNPNPIYPGGLTNVKPSAPNVKASIGSVVKASNGMSGSIYVRINPGSILGGTDSNVQIGTLNNNDFLVYDSSLQYWKNITTADVATIFEIEPTPIYNQSIEITPDVGSVNFTGAGVTASSDINGNVTVNIPGGGGGSSYADINITALDIDWSLGTTYYKDISSNVNFTFSNIVEGKTITVVVTNTSGFGYVSTFPATKQAPGGLDNNLYANSSTVYTFTRSNGVTYCSSFSGVI
jgi:hypothetical protein